jgi:argininosuccinate lyase
MTEKDRDALLLWRKQDAEVDDALMAFMAGEDIVLDRELLEFDIRASRAHAEGLARIGVMTAAEYEAVDASLNRLLEAFRSGAFVLDARFEDGHSAIEAWLIDQLGETGEKIHTGRSRNDQVLVATRLYLRDRLDELTRLCLSLARLFLDRAKADIATPMPGYTHLQRAVVTSLGLWFAGFAEAFADNARLAQDTRRWVNCNPLGTAAGYGVGLPLARELTTERLGFERLQINPVYAQNSRGRFELQALTALCQALFDVRRLSWDLSLFASAEFGFARFPARYTTGSSIMPNKRNPDPVELLRAAPAVVTGAIAELQSVLSLPSGYQRDLQNTKAPLVRGLGQGLAALRITPDLVATVEFDRERMRAALSPDLYATDLAYEFVAEGMPFRQAYQRAAAAGEQTGQREPEASLAARCSPGAPGAPMLETIADRIDALSDEISRSGVSG